MSRRWTKRLLAGASLGLTAILLTHSFGALSDFAAMIAFPYEVDYGEGIVWQQASLVHSADMYSSSTALPFFIANYPPLYFLVTAWVGSFTNDLLQAGRAVSAVSSSMMAILVGVIVWRSTAPPRPNWVMAVAVLAGLSVLCMASVRSWADLMRVDMLAFALSLTGLAISQRRDGALWQTGLALLFCLAAVFTKQTAVAAGLAVALTALRHRGWRALWPIVLVGLAGAALMGLLQTYTQGGYLTNIVGYNINRLFWKQITTVLFYVGRDSLTITAFVLSAAFVGLSWLKLPQVSDLQRAGLPLTHFAICTALLPLAAKSGSSVNYFIEWFAAGGVLCGIAAIQLINARAWLPATALAGVLGLGCLLQPVRVFPAYAEQVAAELPALDAVTARVASADKPVTSENLAIMVRAGKRAMFEPAILKELVLAGKWDEAPLVAMIEARGFAFMLTKDDHLGPNSIRTPAVDAAMRRAYPRVERVAQRLWINLPE